jgi:hypothetical protein
VTITRRTVPKDSVTLKHYRLEGIKETCPRQFLVSGSEQK